MKYWQFRMPEMPSQQLGQAGPLGHPAPVGGMPPARDSEPARRVRTAASAFPPRKRRIASTALPACPSCGAKSLNLSKEKGLKEEFLSVVGGDFYRCMRCEARYTNIFRRFIRIQKPSESRSHRLVFAAIAVGFLCCLAIALYVQRIAHRWPF
jgi:DNA-directed RNA polymerase subunit RPC12/RpoP